MSRNRRLTIKILREKNDGRQILVVLKKGTTISTETEKEHDRQYKKENTNFIQSC